jgi:hypothetical protein
MTADDCGNVDKYGKAYTPTRKGVNVILAYLKNQGSMIVSRRDI